jgi:hypothetical protein
LVILLMADAANAPGSNTLCHTEGTRGLREGYWGNVGFVGPLGIGERPSLLRPRMGLIVDVHHVLDRQLRVTLRCGQTLVTEQFLNRPQIRAFF